MSARSGSYWRATLTRWFPQPLDRWVARITLCNLAIGVILVVLGNHTAPYVRDFQLATATGGGARSADGAHLQPPDGSRQC
jgi:hypothetical protein